MPSIERILAIRTDCRARFGGGGDFLFGHFGIADAMLALPALQAWGADAEAEAEHIEKFDLHVHGMVDKAKSRPLALA